jgi:hypothetical protein
MSFLDDLRAQRTSPQAAWLIFIGAFRKGTLDLFLFLEGHDDVSFYLPYVRLRWKNRGELLPLVCKGKDAVVAIMPRVRSILDHAWRGLFFVDKDLDDYCGYTVAVNSTGRTMCERRRASGRKDSGGILENWGS